MKVLPTHSLPMDVDGALRRLASLAQSEACRSLVCGASDDPSNVCEQLTGFLYAQWYSAVDEKEESGVMLGRNDLTSALRASVASASRFQPGWVVTQSAHDGSCVAANQKQSRELRPGDYANLSRSGLPVAPGDAVAVTECVQWIDPELGFWYLQSAAGSPLDPLARLYWSTRHDQIGFVLHELTAVIDSQNIRYSLKCPFRSADYARVDSLIVYIEREEWPRLQPIVERVAALLKPNLRDVRPPLTRAIAPGVGFAENPGEKESFGENRCRALAPAVRSLSENKAASTEEALGRLISALVAARIDPERPWLIGDYNG